MKTNCSIYAGCETWRLYSPYLLSTTDSPIRFLHLKTKGWKLDGVSLWPRIYKSKKKRAAYNITAFHELLILFHSVSLNMNFNMPLRKEDVNLMCVNCQRFLEKSPDVGATSSISSCLVVFLQLKAISWGDMEHNLSMKVSWNSHWVMIFRWCLYAFHKCVRSQAAATAARKLSPVLDFFCESLWAFIGKVLYKYFQGLYNKIVHSTLILSYCNSRDFLAFS